MKQTLFAIAFALATLSMPAFAQDTRDEPVQFAPGTSGATIKDTITGNQAVNYKLRAKAGQHMVVVLKTDNLSNYFNIFAPGRGPGDGAMFIGPLKGNRYEGTLPADGEYKLLIFLMRNAARRNEKANYTLKIEIDGTAKPGLSDSGINGSAKSGSSDTGSVLWPADTDASGNLPCSAGVPSFERSCAFKVKRNKFGATIWTIKPGTRDTLRVLYFENKAFSSDDDADLFWKRQGDNWWVSAGEREFFIIPDAVIFGG